MIRSVRRAGRQQRSLQALLKRRLLFTVGLLVLGLLLSLLVGLFATINQYNLGQQKVAIRDDLNGILNAMIDQETGLRGYIATGDTTFLGPYTTGRPTYLASLQNLRNETGENSFSNTHIVLIEVQSRADTWYDSYAQIQIQEMQAGNMTGPRSVAANAQGKALFDRFRAAMTQLQQATDEDLSNIQRQTSVFNGAIALIVILLTVAAIVGLWRVITGFASELRKQLTVLQDTTTQIGGGNLDARVGDLSYDELNQLGQNFNGMARALRRQQSVLKERDVLESVLQLNTTLTKSLDVQALTREFLDEVLSLLEVQLAALYLYQPETEQLSLLSASGVRQSELQQTFYPGEGFVGRVALSREPMLTTAPASEEAGAFQTKTILGAVIPATLYTLPLIAGDELLGVMVIGSMYPLHEKARNVLNVVSGSLAAAMSNIQSYQRIQDQADELAIRSRQQENANAELRRQRDKLTILNTALEEANQARSQFLSTMSHELRTPLTAIIGFSQIMLRGSEAATLNSRQKTNLERILKNGQHLLALINDVLDLAKIEAGRMEINYSDVNVREIIASVMEETQSIAIERGLAFTSSVEERAAHLETDEMKLRQILLNLISNALKFTSQGAVTVTASFVAASDTEPERIAIAVKDTGIGIPQDVQEHIFEAFYQADSSNTRKYGGTGLGLSIVREFTDVLGGKLEIQSSPGQGSTFTILVPAHVANHPPEQRVLRLFPEQSAARTGTVDSESPVASIPTITEQLQALSLSHLDMGKQVEDKCLVLAVDDNADVLQVIRSSLEDTAYKVVEVRDSTRVVELVHRLHPCAITLDVMMPGMNGWQILHQLKADPTTAKIPVIMLTVVSDRSTAYVLGADDYLMKPVERNALLKKLQNLCSA